MKNGGASKYNFLVKKLKNLFKYLLFLLFTTKLFANEAPKKVNASVLTVKFTKLTMFLGISSHLLSHYKMRKLCLIKDLLQKTSQMIFKDSFLSQTDNHGKFKQ